MDFMDFTGHTAMLPNILSTIRLDAQVLIPAQSCMLHRTISFSKVNATNASHAFIHTVRFLRPYPTRQKAATPALIQQCFSKKNMRKEHNRGISNETIQGI